MGPGRVLLVRLLVDFAVVEGWDLANFFAELGAGDVGDRSTDYPDQCDDGHCAYERLNEPLSLCGQDTRHMNLVSV